MKNMKYALKNNEFKQIINTFSLISSVAKLAVAVALLLFSSFTVAAAGVTVEDGSLNVPRNVWVNQSTFFVDAALGRIGVGTVTPTAKLDILGTINASRITFGGVDVCLHNGSNCYQNNYTNLNMRLISLNGSSSFSDTGIVGNISALNGSVVVLQSNVSNFNKRLISMNLSSVKNDTDVHFTSLGVSQNATVTVLNVLGSLVVDTNTLYVDDVTNRIGVGTNSPFLGYVGVSPNPGIHLFGVSPLMGFQDSAGGENWLIEAGPTGIGIFNDNDSATALFINNNEFVGVGTNAPAHLFVVGNSQLFNISSTGEVNISGGM